MSLDAYNRLIALLDKRGARYRLIDHVPEGRTEIISHIRENDIRQAAKCIVLMVKLGKKTTKYVLAVIPGHRRVDLSAVKTLFAASYVSFASAETAERLAGSPCGTILPFALSAELELIADPSLKDSHELYFNAARLDRSIALKADDYFAIAQPRLEWIVEDDRTDFVK